MRRATMAGTRGAARSLLPSTAIGKGGAEAAGIIGIGPMMASVAAFLVNYGGKILTNPVSIRVLKNLTDVNLPSTIRQANFARLVRMYPEEFAAFDADLAEMEQIQKEYNRNAKINTQMKSTKETFMEGAGNLLQQATKIGLFKLYYRYSSNISSKSRDFCRIMVALRKARNVFTRKAIINSGSRAVNPGFGKNGSNTYNTSKRRRNE